jgi:hypothetical protein
VYPRSPVPVNGLHRHASHQTNISTLHDFILSAYCYAQRRYSPTSHCYLSYRRQVVSPQALSTIPSLRFEFLRFTKHRLITTHYLPGRISTRISDMLLTATHLFPSTASSIRRPASLHVSPPLTSDPNCTSHRRFHSSGVYCRARCLSTFP